VCTQYCWHVHSHWPGVFNWLKSDHVSPRQKERQKFALHWVSVPDPLGELTGLPILCSEIGAMLRNTAPRGARHRATASRREQRLTGRFAPSAPGRIIRFPAYSVKTHMIISRSILLTSAGCAIFQCSARGAVFRDTQIGGAYFKGRKGRKAVWLNSPPTQPTVISNPYGSVPTVLSSQFAVSVMMSIANCSLLLPATLNSCCIRSSPLNASIATTSTQSQLLTT